MILLYLRRSVVTSSNALPILINFWRIESKSSTFIWIINETSRFDNYFWYPYSRLKEYVYIISFKIARPINYFKYKSTIIFKDITELLFHLKPLFEYPVVTDNINRYHQVLYLWLIIYRQIKLKSYSTLSLTNNDKKTQSENIHQHISNPK